MKAGDDEIDPGGPGFGQVRGHAHGVDEIDDRARGNGHAVGAVGIVDDRQPHAATVQVKRIILLVVSAVREYARMEYSAAVQFGHRRADAFGASVAAMVVGQHGDIHTRIAQGVGQRHRRPEQRVTRVTAAAGEGGFEIHDREVGRPHPGRESREDGPIVEPFSAPRRLDLRHVLHHVSSEPQLHPLGRRNLPRPRPARRLRPIAPRGTSRRRAADRDEDHGGQNMYPTDSHDNCGAKLRNFFCYCNFLLFTKSEF